MARIPVRTASRGLNPGSPVRYPSDLGTGSAIQSFGQSIAGAGATVQGALNANAQDRQRQDDEFENLYAQTEQQRERLDAQEAQRFEEVYQAAEKQRMAMADFSAEQNFQQFKIGVAGSLPDITQKLPASGQGYHDTAIAAFDERSSAFLKDVPEELQFEYQRRLQTERARFSVERATEELATRNAWYTGELEKGVQTAQEQVFQNPDAFEAARSEALLRVDKSGLPDADKQAFRERIEQATSAGLAARLLRDDPAYLTQSTGVASGAVSRPDAAGLVAAVIDQESSGNPNAESPVGASGLMQVMPETGAEVARELGDTNFPVSGTVEEQKAYLKGRDVSVQYGTHYLNKMLDRYDGDIEAALVAYNGGPRRADAWIAAGRDDKVIPKETSAYYKSVLEKAGTAGSAVAMGIPPLQSHINVAKAFVGATEGKDFDVLSSFIKRAAGIDIDPRQTAWCAAFVNAVLGSQGIQGNGSLAARSFLEYGTKTDTPEEGDIVILSRGDPNGWKGHVGFFAGYDANGNVRILGGNQSNKVSVASYEKSRVLGFRRPPDAGSTDKANAMLSQLPGGGPTGGLMLNELDPRLAGLPLADRIKLSDQATKAVSDQLKAAQAQEDAAYTAYKDSFELNILTGGVQSEFAILDDPQLQDGDKSTLLRTFRSQQTEASQVDQDLSAYLTGDGLDLNPLDSADQTRANKMYERFESTLKDQPDEVKQAAADEFIGTTGMIPRQLSADMRRGVMSSEPADIVAGMGIASRVEKMAPEAWRTLSGGEAIRKDLTSFQHLVNGRGFSAEDAARKILERRTDEYRRGNDLRGTEADKLVRDLEVTDVTDAFDSGVFSSEPGAGADIQTRDTLASEYREAFRDAFVKTGDEEEAKTVAIRELKQVWGVSTISGDKQLMKFPPEKVYPAVGGGHDWLRDDMKTTVSEVYEGETSKVWLRPIPGTAADYRAKRPARYQLWYEYEKNGQKIIDAVPGAWAGDMNMAKTKTAEMMEQAMRDARADRSFIESSGMDPFGANVVLSTGKAIKSQAERVQSLLPGTQQADDAMSELGFGVSP